MSTETRSEPASSTTADPADGWFTPEPDDWAGFCAFRARVNESRRSRNALRDWMLNHLDEGKDARRLGIGLFAAGEPERAAEYLEAADDDLCRLLLGHVRVAQRRPDEAVELWKTLTGSESVGAAAQVALAVAHHDRGDAESLEALAGSLRGVEPADQALVEGLLAEVRGDAEDAVAAWQRGLEADPDHTEITFRLGTLLDRLGDDDAALELLGRFRGGDLPAHVGALVNLGILYEDREQHGQAAACFRLVVQADPRNRRARRYLEDAEASTQQFYDESRERKADKQNAVLRIPVTDFELSVRARNCLQRMNIHTLGDLVCRSESELLSFKNFGETSLQEVKDILGAKGLRLGMITPPDGAAPAPGLALPEDADPRDINVSDLDLSVRSRAALATLGITKVADLCQTTETTLLSCKNFGQTSLDEIKSKLRGLGLELTS